MINKQLYRKFNRASTNYANRFRKNLKDTNASKGWFEKHQAAWTFGATLISGLALVVSIYVIIEQKKDAKENLQLAKKQIELAKAQFDSSLADHRQSAKEISKRFFYEDSINKIQFSLSTNTFRMQDYINKVQLEKERPEINIDSIWFIRNNRIIIGTSNIGTRPFDFDEATLSVINVNYETISLDTIKANLLIPRGESLILNFEKSIPDSVLNDYDNNVYYLTIHSEDVILKSKTFFNSCIFIYGNIRKNENVNFSRTDTKRMIVLIRKFLKTKNWGRFIKGLSTL